MLLLIIVERRFYLILSGNGGFSTYGLSLLGEINVT
jgi:hypothetical protein